MSDSNPPTAKLRERVRRLPRCAIYARESRSSQKILTSCDVQDQVCREFCENHSWPIVDGTYHDSGGSSETLDRPSLQRMLHDIKAGEIDIVVIYRLDRLTRRVRDFARLMEEFEQHDVELLVVTNPNLTVSNATRLFMINLAISVAEFEQDITRERLADARAAHKRRGRRVAGVVPYGYDTVSATKQWVIVPQESRRVAKIFAMALEGQTPTEIAKVANKRGWRTKQRTSKAGRVTGGGKWTARQILATLSNPVYAGHIHDGDETRPGIHKAIVEQSVFDDVQEIIALRRTRSPGRSEPFCWSLRGLLCCGGCGRPMSPSVSGYRNVRYRYYRCRSDAGGKPPCKGVSLPAQEIEDFVIKTIAEETLRGSEDSSSANDPVEEFLSHWSSLTQQPQLNLLKDLVDEVVYDAKKSTITVNCDPDVVAGYWENLKIAD